MIKEKEGVPITAFMPGRIIAVATATVAAGAALFTMEAMKMNFSIRAPEVAAVGTVGTFVAIVSAGADVVFGDVIGYFFPAEKGDSTLAGCSYGAPSGEG